MAMGMMPSPWVTTRLFAWAMEVLKGDRRDQNNPFHWTEVKMNCPGSDSYDQSMPRVFKWNSFLGCIACDCKTFVDDLRSIGATAKLCKEATHQIETLMAYLGLQDATRKKRPGAQAPGEWTGTIARAVPNVGLFVTISQVKWDKGKAYLSAIWEAFVDSAPKMPRLNLKALESKIGFLVHLAMAYPIIFPFLKGFYLTMNSWRTGREADGWKMSCRAHEAYMQAARRQSDVALTAGSDESDAPEEVTAVPLLLEQLDTIIELIEGEYPALRLIWGAKQLLEVLYIFGDASGAGFGASWSEPSSGVVGFRGRKVHKFQLSGISQSC